MDNDGWKWKVGFLHGFGDAVWQELFGKIRRITKVIATPQGIIFAKAIPCVASTDKEPQFDVEKMVIDSTDPKEELASDIERAWIGGMIVPANGARFKP